VSPIGVSMVRSRIAMHVKFNIYAGVIPGFWCSGCETRTKKYGSHTRIIMPSLNATTVLLSRTEKYIFERVSCAKGIYNSYTFPSSQL
jgi:hypothetical protein